MAAQASDCNYCSSYIPQAFAPPDMGRSNVLEILHNVLSENSQSRNQLKKWKAHIPHIPSDLFTYEEESSDEGEGRKYRGTKRKRTKRKRKNTRYQRGGGARRKVAQIMTLIVYTSIIYWGVPYVGDSIAYLETLLVSSGLLPKLCGSLEEVAAILMPGDNICRLHEVAYDRAINGISASLVGLAAGWGYVRGNIWDTATRDWNALTAKFENMLVTFQNNKAVDIVTDGVDIDYDNEYEVEGVENAKTLAVLYKQELEEAEVNEEFGDMGVLGMIYEPDSQDHWGPDYSGMEWGDGRRRHHRHHRHRRHHSTRRLKNRGRGRGRGCMGGTRRK